MCSNAGQQVRRSSTEESDIENVNPQAVAANKVHFGGPSVPAALVTASHQTLSEAAPPSSSLQTASTAAPAAAPAAKPFVSSKVLSEQLFGSGESPQAATAVKAPVSPFAEASTAAPLSGAGGRGMTGAGTPRPGTGATPGLEAGVSSGLQRLDGTSKDSGNAERVEEALMGTASPFSRPLSSDEVKPVLARLSQTGSIAVRKEEQPRAVPQAAGESAVQGRAEESRSENAANITGALARPMGLLLVAADIAHHHLSSLLIICPCWRLLIAWNGNISASRGEPAQISVGQ